MKTTSTVVKPIDKQALRDKVRTALPVPFFKIDGFLDDTFADEIVASLPTYEDLKAQGKMFNAVNEKGKVQFTDASKFPAPVARLHEELSCPEFLSTLSYVMDIPNLLADEQLVGGGIHMTGPRGRLDVHIDFNYIPERQLHRRLNILVFLNKGWKEQWGGKFELWDQDVKVCHHAFSPIFNRCVVFATSDISYHGVTAVTCPPDVVRRSFAAYYYTREAPPGWDGSVHSTIFKARPDEVVKGKVLMPLERWSRWAHESARAVKRKLIG